MGSAILISRSLFGLENGRIRLWLMGWVGQWEEERVEDWVVFFLSLWD